MMFTIGNEKSYDKGLENLEKGLSSEFKKLGKTDDPKYLGDYKGLYPGGIVFFNYRGARDAADSASTEDIKYAVYELEDAATYVLGKKRYLEHDTDIIRKVTAEYAEPDKIPSLS